MIYPRYTQAWIILIFFVYIPYPGFTLQKSPNLELGTLVRDQCAPKQYHTLSNLLKPKGLEEHNSVQEDRSEYTEIIFSN